MTMTATHTNRLPTAPAGGLRGWVQRHPMAAFFILAYALTWLIWIPAAAVGQRLFAVRGRRRWPSSIQERHVPRTANARHAASTGGVGTRDDQEPSGPTSGN